MVLFARAHDLKAHLARARSMQPRPITSSHVLNNPDLLAIDQTMYFVFTTRPLLLYIPMGNACSEDHPKLHKHRHPEHRHPALNHFRPPNKHARQARTTCPVLPVKKISQIN